MGLPPIDWALAFVLPPLWRQAALVGLELSGSGRKEVFLFPGVTKAPGNAFFKDLTQVRALSFEEKFLRLNIGEWASDDFDVDMDSNLSWPSGSTWSSLLLSLMYFGRREMCLWPTEGNDIPTKSEDLRGNQSWPNDGQTVVRRESMLLF